jgi:hypothetical protein
MKSFGIKKFGIQKDDPPGGTTGRVGCGTGVDEAPVPDAGSTTERFREMRKRFKQNPESVWF